MLRKNSNPGASFGKIGRENEILNMVVREGFTKKTTFNQILERHRRMNHTDISGKNI